MRVIRLDFRFPNEPQPLFRMAGLDLPDQGLGCVIASSGSGKTTLLRCLSGWYDATGGAAPGAFTADTSFDRIADTWFIGAHPRFLPWLTMAQNVAGLAGQASLTAARSLGASLELSSVAWDQRPQELSFGMYKRFELIVGLLRPGKLLLLDEFFTSLDDRLKTEALQQIRLYGAGRFTLCVTHEQTFAREHADTVYRWRREDETITGLEETAP